MSKEMLFLVSSKCKLADLKTFIAHLVNENTYESKKKKRRKIKAFKGVLASAVKYLSPGVCRIRQRYCKKATLLFPDVLLNGAVSPGLILPGLLPKMDFLLFLSFPLLEPDAFRVDRPVPIK